MPRREEAIATARLGFSRISRKPGSVCASLAASDTGPCYVCGPKKTSSTQQLCSGACTQTITDDLSLTRALPSSLQLDLHREHLIMFLSWRYVSLDSSSSRNSPLSSRNKVFWWLITGVVCHIRPAENSWACEKQMGERGLRSDCQGQGS
jgi:hypothetical protein